MKNKRVKFDGIWHITEIENWDEDYFNIRYYSEPIKSKVQ
jgi:hypothetical protein